MSEVYSLVYRSIVTGRLTGEVYDSIDVLNMVIATHTCIMKDGHYMVFKGDFKEASE